MQCCTRVSKQHATAHCHITLYVGRLTHAKHSLNSVSDTRATRFAIPLYSHATPPGGRLSRIGRPLPPAPPGPSRTPPPPPQLLIILGLQNATASFATKPISMSPLHDHTPMSNGRKGRAGVGGRERGGRPGATQEGGRGGGCGRGVPKPMQCPWLSTM